MLKPRPGGFNEDYRSQLLAKIRALGGAQNEAATASKAEEAAGRVEEELTIPAAPALEIERSPVTTPSAVPFEAESADFVDPISDDEFQSALEEQLAIPAEPAPEPAPRMPAPAWPGRPLRRGPAAG